MCKIVHVVIFEYYHEGYSYQENLLSQKHKELGEDVTIIALENDGKQSHRGQKLDVGEYYNEYGIRVIVLPKTHHNIHIRRFFDISSGLYSTLNIVAPDIIFLHNFRGTDVRHICKYIRNHPSVKLYVDSHDDYYNEPLDTFSRRFRSYEWRNYAQKLLPYTIKFWGTIPWREKYLKEVYKIPSSKVDLLIMGADEKKIIGRDKISIRKNVKQHYSIPQDAFLVVSGGKIDKRKQLDLLMEAVSQMDERVWLLVFGSPTEEMKEIINKYRDTKNIVLTGWVPSDMAYDFFLASDLAFFPGTHSVLWEQAVACGLPIVVKKWEWIQHIQVCNNAILLEEVTVESIKEAIDSLLWTSLYDSMIKNAKEAAPNFYLKPIAIKSVGLEDKYGEK